MMVAPKQAFAFSVMTAEILAKIDSGVRPATEAEIATYTMVRAIPAGSTVPDKSADWLSPYLAAAALQQQQPTGACTGCSRTVAQKGLAINVHRCTSYPDLSWLASYYMDLGRPDKTVEGSSVSSAFVTGEQVGACREALWPQSLCQSIGFPAVLSAQPTPECYTDAAKHKILSWGYIGSLRGNIDDLKWWLARGYPVSIAIGQHATTIFTYDGPWCFAVDSMLADVNLGQGFGIRAYHQDLLLGDPTTGSIGAFNCCVPLLVDISDAVGGIVTPPDPGSPDVPLEPKPGTPPPTPPADTFDLTYWFAPFAAPPPPHGPGNYPPGFLPPYQGDPDKIFRDWDATGCMHVIVDMDTYRVEYTVSGNTPNGYDDTGTRIPRFNKTGMPNPSTGIAASFADLIALSQAAQYNPVPKTGGPTGPTGPAPAGPNAPVIAALHTDVDALVDGHVTQAQIDALKADAGLLVVDGATGPTGPTAPTGPTGPTSPTGPTAPPGINVALAGVAVASSTMEYQGLFKTQYLNDGDTFANKWVSGSVHGPDWAGVSFAAPQTIAKVVVYSGSDNYNPTEPPSDTLTSKYNNIDTYVVEARVGGVWTQVASVTGNDLVKRTFNIAPVLCDAVRVNVVYQPHDHISIHEVEAWT